MVQQLFGILVKRPLLSGPFMVEVTALIHSKIWPKKQECGIQPSRPVNVVWQLHLNTKARCWSLILLTVVARCAQRVVLRGLDWAKLIWFCCELCDELFLFWIFFICLSHFESSKWIRLYIVTALRMKKFLNQSARAIWNAWENCLWTFENSFFAIHFTDVYRLEILEKNKPTYSSFNCF